MSESTRNVLVVGGSSGIGSRVVDRLVQRGDHVTVASRSAPGLEAAPQITTQQFDVTDRSQTLDLPDSLDALIYMPGTITVKPFHRLAEEDFDRDMDVNCFGVVRVLQQALPALKRTKFDSAAVLLFSSVAATTGMPFHASIATAKSAVEGLARSLAAEWAPRIRVNAIAPSLTDTQLAASFLSSEDRVTAAANRHPLNRVGQPAEVAELAEFLVGDGARFVTGQVWGINGGLSSVRKF
jgi:3-oxoacyl-[acyl-carrier protein] reductase